MAGDNIRLVKNFPWRSNDCIQKLCYGLGHVYNDLCAAIWFSYTLFYFQIILEIKPTLSGTLIMIGQVADALATPTIGWAIDRTGAPQAWHSAGTFCVAVGFLFIFSLNPGRSFLYYAAFVILFQLGWAVVQISHLSVIPIVSRDVLHSADLTAIRYTASICSNIFVYLITWVILQNDQISESIGPDDYVKFKDIAWIITGIGIFCSLIYYCGIRTENGNLIPYELENDSATEVRSTNGKSYDIYFVSVMYMSSRLYTILNLIYIPLYLEETNMDIRGSIASVPLASFCASFMISVLFKCTTKFCNNKVVYFIGSIFSMSGSSWIAFGMAHTSLYDIYAIVCFTGIGSSATIISSLCLTAEIAKINVFGGGSVYSTVTFTDKLISGIVILIIQHQQCEPKSLCPHFYEYVLAFAGGGAATLGLITLLLLHCQNAKRINVY